MATAVRGFDALRVYLDMIKIEHSVFALPFAMLGMVWGAGGWPGWWKFGWILIAMISCRSAAMAFNRIVDRHIDAVNPRTRTRALPAGLLKLGQVNLFFWSSCGLFALSAWMLGPLPLILSPIALGVTLFYSFTKRFTPLSHFVLGFSLGIAPAGAWIAASGLFDPKVLFFVFAVTFWTAGFDILYSLQDEDFDREQGLRSLPETVGKSKALGVSRVCHFLTLILLGLGGVALGSGWIYYLGVVGVAAMLFYEQSLVKPDDLNKINLAFFTLNGFVSISFFAFALADWLI